MRLLILIIGVCLSLACTTVSTTEVAAIPAPSPRLAALIAEENVKPDPAGTKPWGLEEIDRVTGSIGRGKLRELRLAENDIEVRMWVGFGLTTLHGFILKRAKDKWSAGVVSAKFKKPSTFIYNERPLPQPHSSWDTAWRSLLEQGILILPDGDAINCSEHEEDGFVYVVEIKKGSAYRTYSYSNPESKVENHCEQAGRILSIEKIISTLYEGMEIPASTN